MRPCGAPAPPAPQRPAATLRAAPAPDGPRRGRPADATGVDAAPEPKAREPMPTGRVKVFNAERNFGFVTTAEGDEIYVPGDQVADGPLRSGDEVEFEVGEGANGKPAANGVTVTKQAPADNPIGRTMVQPPSWDELEERERQRRAARRRRR
ncbi:cold shock domain-containing protein [Nitriliruptoraceae bacterium ZYF776]|nr:cold shock domain-containing protein [Profundirhabdus halotolerans]